jgi:hypothetical protein
MAVNRFWGDAPTAQYTPLSMQELAFVPQQMYTREKDVEAKVDAMNEAKTTLVTMLGDKAGKTDEFEVASANLMNRMAKEGATQRLLEEAKGLRKLYLRDVAPMEQFANQRQELYKQYLKDKSTGENILLGQNPLEQSFDDWTKRGRTLEPYQAVDRNKLLSHGILIGKNFAEGEVREDVDKYGFLNVQKGFKNADEAMEAYQSNPQFKSWVDSQTELSAKAAGVEKPNQEVRDAIRSGIMTSVVGGVERHQLPSEILKNIGAGQNPQYAKPALVRTAITATGPELPSQNIEDIISIAPEAKKDVDKRISDATGGKYPTLQQMDDRIKSLKPVVDRQIQIGLTGYAPADAWNISSNTPEYKEYSNLLAGREKILSDTQAAQPWKSHIMINPDWESIQLFGDKKLTEWVDNYRKAVGENLRQNLQNLPENSLNWGGGDEVTREFIGNGKKKGKFTSPDTSDRAITFNGIHVNSVTGQIFFDFSLSAKDNSGSKPKDISMEHALIKMPPRDTRTAVDVFTSPQFLGGENPSDENNQRLALTRQLYNRWEQSSLPVLSKIKEDRRRKEEE